VQKKTKIGYVFGVKNRTVQKFDIYADGFQIETAYNLQFRLKVTKNNFTYI